MTRRRWWLLAALACAFASPIAARATPSPIDARVLWVRGSNVYLAAPDSSLIAGDSLTFVFRKRAIATGIVARAYDSTLTLASLVSGSLDRARDLRRVSVLVEHATLRPRSLLRLGVPRAHRVNLLFRCDSVALGTSSLPGDYRAVSSTDGATLWVRSSEAANPWPDSLSVISFSESADEEIALERGDLDLGMFWPGELSRTLREQPQRWDVLLGTRSRGWLEVDVDGTRSRAEALADSTKLSALNLGLFRGDLLSLPCVPSSVGPVSDSDSTALAANIVAEPSIPGRNEINRYLPIDLRETGSRGVTRSLTLRYADAPRSTRDASTSVFAIRCPLVCAPALRAYVNALGVDRLVDLIECPRPASASGAR